MPKHRPPKEVWQELRRKVWERDGGRCQGPYCQEAPPLPLNRCHIDHIHSGKLAHNSLSNLRVLCRRCHVLRLDPRHRGMIAAALRDGIIPTDWRRFTWDDSSWPSQKTIETMSQWGKSRRE
ncbi:MAG: HNH endonuclease [Anaerolineae bacterium]|nr:HNH endonuclease [Anaerolineae bacterium]